ncbi:MAG: hypothetical protein B6D61_12475 [Bacteroidetes bacterium 4484_249]|nr:MAG: hypothetical protein B6D61_12475 [Bacteroidetes bacterium 4484_249]
MENRIAVCNSSPIINLSKIHKLGLLKLLFRKVIIPNAVYDELFGNTEYINGSNEIKELIEDGTIEVKSVADINLVKVLRDELDYGESEVIALALEEKADIVIIDELEARKKAELFNLKKTGFIGLLIKAHKLNYIGDFIELLDIAIDKGFWINKNLYNRICKDFE